ncbi:polysaccharide deacetylase family protein [Oscillibacter sp.]|uniref:polysaccharide deacetylase family protein n=1 Tax=Oscillibacter sp. TaxID=1945593 RepID=UPI001B599DF0|nr:polysaccharide deacetylase family protein [Oscillibacter sp.]MBP3508915.1 polysaccharide deacetylase family protein [Oscillibacter sp.]
MKKKRWAALVLCLLLVFQLAAPWANAAGSVYFVAAGNEVLPLSDETMPFWSGGYLYIAASTFSGSSRRALGVSYMGSGQTAVLYNSSGDHSLIFDLSKDYTQDREGNISYPGALRRGGVVFVPAYLVAKYFNLMYSVMEVEYGHLVWLRQPNVSMTDKQFANAAVYPCAISYTEYMKKKKEAQTEEPSPPSASGTEIDGKSVYLCLEAGDNTSALLDALDRYDAQAAFFCTPEFLASQGGLLRRMTAGGSSIGILVDAADTSRTVEEQLAAGNQSLRKATCGGTRLVMIRGGKEEDLQAAREAGYRCVEPTVDRTAYELKSASNAQSLLKRVSGVRGNVSVWLGDTVGVTGLRSFLAAIEDADGRCLALTETS